MSSDYRYFNIPNEHRSTLGTVTNKISCCCFSCAKDLCCRIISCIGCYICVFLIIFIPIYLIFYGDQLHYNSTTQFLPF